MIFTKFHENRLIIDGENEKHALLVECSPGYSLGLGSEPVEELGASSLSQ